MANTSKINGLVPVRYQGGGLYTGAANIYEIVVGDGTATMIGDLVKADAGTATDVYPTCVRHGTTGEVTSGLALGVIVGFVVVASGLDAAVPTLDVPLHRRASTKRFALVADDPRLVFEIQDGATTATPVSSIGLNTGFMATAGSTVTGASGMTTGTTSATTFKVRVGGSSAATSNMTFNGYNGGRIFGGTQISCITVEEIGP